MNESGRGNQEIYNEKEERQEQGRGIKRKQKTGEDNKKEEGKQRRTISWRRKSK